MELFMSLRFLLTAWGNPGNLTPLLTAARRLHQKGHHVRILGEAEHQAETTKAGFETLSWRRPAPIRKPDLSGEDPVQEEIRMLVGQVMFGSALDYAADTMDAVRSESVDAILTSDFLTGPVIAAEAAGIPCALLAPHVSLRPLDGVPAVGCGLIPSGTPDYRATEHNTRTRLVDMLNSHLPTLNRARAAFGLPPLNHVLDHYDRADRVLIGLSPAFDFPAERLPANLRYVGPLLDPPGWARPWTAPWSGTPIRPRVLVSLSTSFQNQLALLRRIVAALGTLELDAIVTTGPAMEAEQLDAPANVSIIHSAPHDLIMREVSLVVTHGGHGTITRSLLNGLPLLVIPMGRDQSDNAVRVVARGAGIALTDSATEDEITGAVKRLIAEPRFQAAAGQLGDAIASDGTSSLLVEELETIASTRRWRRSA
jgi:MGT family glycosyltransferase